MVATLFLRQHIHSDTILDASLMAAMLFFTIVQALFSGIGVMTLTVRFGLATNNMTLYQPYKCCMVLLSSMIWVFPTDRFHCRMLAARQLANHHHHGN